MAEEYVPPQYGKDGYNCPHCGAFSYQRWRQALLSYQTESLGGEKSILNELRATICDRCKNYALWVGVELIYPRKYVAPLPAKDMPDNVKGDYTEARSIFPQSPRGAAALLRLAIQELVIELGESGKDLNKDIGNLVRKGLRVDIQKALDVVRVIGNNAVHPGQISIEDNPDIALKLFNLANMIVEQMITQPREINELFEVLPEGAKNAIDKRDKAPEPE